MTNQAPNPPNPLARLDTSALPVDGLLRARVWDVLGAAATVPMVLFGFFSWFGLVGDTGGEAGFYNGTGAAAIALSVAAGSVALNQMLSGRPHRPQAPPVQAFLAAGSAVVVLGGMLAKPDSVTVQVGSFGGLMVAVAQAILLTVGWVKGSGKTVKAANLRAVDAEQEVADAIAEQRAAALAAMQARAAAGQNPWITPGQGQWAPTYPVPPAPPGPPAPPASQPQYPGYPQPAWAPHAPAYPQAGQQPWPPPPPPGPPAR